MKQRRRRLFDVRVDVTPGDSGNYTCQVEGPQNTILGQTTHFVYVRG